MTRLHHRAALLLAASTLAVQAQDVRKGLISYWPLDAISGDGLTTPDLVTGNHLTLNSITASNLTPGRHGQAMSFDGFFTYLSYRAGAQDTGLPVSRSPQYTIMFWTKGLVAGTGTSDDRVFSESYSQSNNPLVNVGTHNTGADNTVDIFVRDLGGTVRVNHFHGTGQAFDDQWRHVAFVVANGVGTIYLDGAVDSTVAFNTTPFEVDITSVGAIVRGPEGADAVAAYYTGVIDEVAVWERALTAAEVADVKENRIATPVPAFAPEITLDPVGNADLRVGRSYTLSAKATGSRPLSYQWRKGNQNIEGATGATYTIDTAETADTGDYTVVVTNGGGSATSAVATVQVNEAPPPDLKRDLVAYYPFSEVEGTRTPDYASGYDMTLVNLTAADLVPGKVGTAMRFENARRTLLTRVSPSNFSEGLPINQHPAFSVAFWAQVDTLANNLVDLRLFSEGSTTTSDPLFNIGTDNTGATASVNLFIRRAGWTAVNHIKSVAQPFDGQWHHVVFVQEPDGSRAIFVDGVRDELVIPAKPEGAWNVNTTTIGGILRSSASHWVTGLIDEVALWKRGLSEAEITQLFTQGMPAIPRYQEPLVVRAFSSDFQTVSAGDKVVLNWDVAKFSTVSISPAPGDVTGQTTFGVGSAEVTVNADTTYTITVARDGQQVTATTQVKVLNNVAAGWRLLENFENLAPGPLAGQGNWKNPDGVATVLQLKNNKALGYDAGQDLAALDLRSRTLNLGQKASLFFRVHVTPASTEVIGINVGLTDKPIRFVGDFAGDVGPFTRIERADIGADVNILARYGNGGNLDIGNGPGGPFVLQPGRTYNVWIDVQNNDINTGGDTYSVHIQAEGDAQRVTVFTDYIEDRNPAGSQDLGLPQPNLNSLLASAVGANQGVNTVYVDDFFISQPGAFLATTPVPAGSFDPAPVVTPKGSVVWVTFHGGENTPSAAAATAGFTEAPDAAYTRLLTENGYTVSRVITTATPAPATFADAKVVIIGRSVPSGNYQNAGATAWNSIAKPIIVMGGYTIRNSRMGYTTGGTIPDTAGEIRLAVEDPSHPIFAGVTLDASNVTANPFAGLATFNGTTQRGISVNTDPLAGGGRRLASVRREGDPANGGLIIGEWAAGGVMANGTADTLAGPRLVFLSGSREASGLTSEGAGIYDLTEDGARMFLNAVAYMAGGGPVSQKIDLTRNADGSVTLTYTGVLTSADTLDGAYTPVAGAASPHTVTPSGAARFYKVQ